MKEEATVQEFTEMLASIIPESVGSVHSIRKHGSIYVQPIVTLSISALISAFRDSIEQACDEEALKANSKDRFER